MPMLRSSRAYFPVLQSGRNFRHNSPIDPDAMITAIPIHIPSPPMINLTIAVIIMATIVGIIPKKSPATESMTDLVSKTIPGTNNQGVNINKMPIALIISPVTI